LPSSIGRFQVRARVGAGAFGTVYRAYDPQLDREVALKVPLSGTLDDPQQAERFLREARAAAQLRHPHIVPLFEAGGQPPDCYLVSAFIEGRTLASALQGGPFESRAAARIVRDLAEALAYAHRLGIVHRDVKPANVILDAREQPHLLDFGLARRLDTAERLTQEGALVGTPAYMAPEQVTGRRAEDAPASDQYSLGVLLYELLTGRTPHDGPPEVILFNVLRVEPPPPRSVNPRVPRDLETICLKAMARDPRQRYASALALAEDLDRFAAGEPIRARRAGPVRRALRWAARHPVPVASAAVGLLAVVTAAVLVAAYLGVLRRQQDLDDLRTAFDDGLKHPEATRAYFERMEGHLDRLQRLAPRQVPELRERLTQRVADTIRADLEQPRLTPEAEDRARAALAVLAEHAPEAAATLEQVLRDRQSDWQLLFDLRPPFADWQQALRGPLHPRDDSLVREPATEGPAGGLVLTREERPGAVRLDATFDPTWGKAASLGLVLNRVEGPTDEVTNLAIPPDGRSVVVLCGSGGQPCTQVCDLATGQVRAALPAVAPNFAVAFAPGGRRLATAGPGGSVRLWGFPGGEELATVPAPRTVVRGLAFSPDGHTLASGGEDGDIHFWDVAADGHALRQRGTIARGHDQAIITDVAFAPDGQALASAGSDGTIRVWDPQTRQLLQTLRGHAGLVYHIAFNPAGDGPLLASASHDGTVRLWRRDTYQEEAVLPAGAGWAHAVAFSPDGRTVAAAYAGKCVKLWDVATRAERRQLAGFTDRVSAVAFAPDGKSLVTGEVNHAVKRWDAVTGADLWALEPSAGYALLLRLPEVSPRDLRPQPTTLADALAQGRLLRMQIYRNDRLQRERAVPVRADAPLHLRASREGDRLEFQINDQEPLEFQDVFPLGSPRPGVLGLDWPAGAGVEQVRAEWRRPPASPSLLEQGDAAYASNRFAEAADCYGRQAESGAGADAVQEARYKRALSLLALHQPAEALLLLRHLAGGVMEAPRSRWGLLAACQLWLYHLKQSEYEEADEFFKLLESHYRSEQLAALIPEELRGQILQAYRGGELGSLRFIESGLRYDPNRSRILRHVVDVENLFQAPWSERVQSAHALCMRQLLNEELDEAVRTPDEVLRSPDLPEYLIPGQVVDLVRALRRRGDAERALAELNQRLGAPQGSYLPELLTLLLERARLRAARGETEAAEKDIDAFLRQLNPTQWSNAPLLVAMAHTVRGFLREQRGDAAGAQASWKEALRVIKGTNWQATYWGFLLGSLTNDLTETDVAFSIEHNTRDLGIPAASLIRKGGWFEPAWVASVMRNTWRSPRGHDYARRIALDDLPAMDSQGIQFALFIAEAFREGSLDGPPSADQEALIWQVSDGVYRSYTHGEFLDPQAYLGLRAWTGVTGLTGWGGLSASLARRPDLRGPLAYLYGLRYLRLKRQADARALFQTALKDAKPDTPLYRLTREALDQTAGSK
jgi:WD40 repeat protein